MRIGKAAHSLQPSRWGPVGASAVPPSETVPVAVQEPPPTAPEPPGQDPGSGSTEPNTGLSFVPGGPRHLCSCPQPLKTPHENSSSNVWFCRSAARSSGRGHHAPLHSTRFLRLGAGKSQPGFTWRAVLEVLPNGLWEKGWARASQDGRTWVGTEPQRFPHTQNISCNLVPLNQVPSSFSRNKRHRRFSLSRGTSLRTHQCSTEPRVGMAAAVFSLTMCVYTPYTRYMTCTRR